MIGLSVELAEAMPTYAVHLRLDGPGLRVTVSPRVGAKILTALHPDVAEAVSTAVAKHRREHP